jgi:hypothetical protein
MSDAPDTTLPHQHITESARLLRRAEDYASSDWPHETGETKTDVLLAALTHAVLAMAKMQGRGRA